MHNRKNLSIMLAFVLFIGLIFIGGNEAKALGVDSKLPADFRIVLDKQEATYGEEVKIEIITSSPESKLGNEAYVAYVDENNKIVKEITLTRDGQSFLGKIEIGNEFSLGMYKIDFIVFEMVNENNVIVYNKDVHTLKINDENCLGLSNGNLLVKDFAGYELFKNVTVNTGNVNYLESVLLEVQANSSNGPLSSKAYALYTLENNGETFYKEVVLSLGENDVYKAALNIDESFRPGTWKLDYIILKDQSGHTDVVYNKEMHGTIDNKNFKYLSSGNIDVNAELEGPKMVAVSLKDLKTVPINTFEIKIKVQDDSNLNDVAWLKYVTQDDKRYMERDLKLQLKDGVYVGHFQKDDDYQWDVDYIIFKDEFENTTCIYNSKNHEFNSMNLDALAINSDDRAPGITKVSVEDTEINGEYFVKIDTDENKGELAAKAYVVYTATDDTKTYEKEIMLSVQDSSYVGIFSANEFDVPLTWKIDYVILTDKSGNTSIHYNSAIHEIVENGMNLSSGNIDTVAGDVAGPELMDMVISHKNFDINNNILVDVDIEILAQDKTGLYETAYVLYKTDDSSKEREIKLTLDADGKYKTKTRFTNADAGEKWIIDYVILKDTIGHTNVVYNSAIHGIGKNLSHYDITVEGVKVGINRFNVDTTDVYLTRAAVIEIESIGIEGNGVGYALYVNLDGEEREIKMSGRKNIITGKFEDITDGAWMLSYVIVGDDKGNSQIIYNTAMHGAIYPGIDLSGANIIVETKLPEIESVSVTGNTLVLYNNESIKLTVDVVDKSLVGYNAYVKYVGEKVSKELKMTRAGVGYEVDITMDDETPVDNLVIDYIIITDNDGNEHITYNSAIHGMGIDMSVANISIENPAIGLDVVSVDVNLNAIDFGGNVEVTVEVSKGAFDLRDKAYMSFMQAEAFDTRAIEVVLTKVGETTYKGTFIPTEISQLGHWKPEYIIVSDVMGNTKMNYNASVHGLGDSTRLWKGNVVVGEVAVYCSEKPVPGEDFTPVFWIKNMTGNVLETTVIMEVMDENDQVISKVKVTKVVAGGTSELLESRVKLVEDAARVRIITLDENRQPKYVILDYKIK